MSDNVTELADILSDTPNAKAGTHDLQRRDKKFAEEPEDTVTMEIQDRPHPPPGPGDDPKSPADDHKTETKPKPGHGKKTAQQVIRDSRILQNGKGEHVMTFTTPPEPARRSNLRSRPSASNA